MVALIIWWVYCRNRLPAAMICAGLICSVTRSAWMGTALAIAVLAVIMRVKRRRFYACAGIGVALFAASIPLLGLGDFLLSTKAGEEPSAQGHQESLLDGLDFVLGHPLGSGPGNYDRPAASNHPVVSTLNAPFIENSYLMLASEYGIVPGLCFLGFLVTALVVSRQERMLQGYTSVGILVGFGAAMLAMLPSSKTSHWQLGFGFCGARRPLRRKRSPNRNLLQGMLGGENTRSDRIERGTIAADATYEVKNQIFIKTNLPSFH